MKYYVVSNEVRHVVGGPHITSPREAAKEAMLQCFQEGVCIAPVIVVSERGFSLYEHGDDEDDVYSTEDILKEAGFTFEDEEYE